MLLSLTPDPYGQHYLAVSVNGTLQFIPLEDNPQPALFPELGLRLCMYVPSSDDMMNALLGDARELVAEDEYGYF